jgi:hypothetical protein
VGSDPCLSLKACRKRGKYAVRLSYSKLASPSQAAI